MTIYTSIYYACINVLRCGLANATIVTRKNIVWKSFLLVPDPTECTK